MIVERYDVDGTVTQTKMSRSAWDEFREEMIADPTSLQEMGIAFYMAWKEQRHAWNGSRRLIAIGALVPSGCRVEMAQQGPRLAAL